MTEKTAIIADPISSDGSEESWILLDEMDEAMNEDFHFPRHLTNEQSDEVDQSSSTETITKSNPVEAAVAAAETVDAAEHTEIAQGTGNELRISDDIETVEDATNIDTNSEAISACPSDDEEVDVPAHLRSVFGTSNTLQAYDDLNDGSTTDGSISMLGDHEINQSRYDADDLSLHASAPQPLQMWMRCTPIDMTICSKRPLEARSLDSNQYQPPATVGELDAPNLVEDIFSCLERLNNFLSSIYLLQVVLLFLTAGGVAVLAIIYSRYSACKLEVKDLEQKLYSAKMEKYQLEGNLAHCQYLYEKEVETATNVEFKTESSLHDSKSSAENIIIPTVHSHTDCQADGECVIQPTRLSAENAKNDAKRTVWTGADDDLLATKKPIKSKENYLSECDDESGLFSEYNREYCENYKNRALEPQNQPEKVYSTHYSYKAVDDRECNPSKIDFSLGIEHARKILREMNCDDDGTMKYLQQVYDNYQTKTKDNEHGKARKEHKKLEKEKEKSKTKWEKGVQNEHGVIKVDRIDANSSEEHYDRNQKRERRDKNQHKERDSDKENKRKNDRKDTKKHQHEIKENAKWNKNDRKRDMVKVYDHRHDD